MEDEMQSKIEELKAKYQAAFRVASEKAVAATALDRAAREAALASTHAMFAAGEIERELMDAIREEVSGLPAVEGDVLSGDTLAREALHAPVLGGV